MEKVRFGRSKEQISVFGLGTMYFGSKVNQKKAFDLLDYYIAKGGNFIDSANKYASWIPNYQGGESENLIGKWLQKRKIRNRILISSKVGFPYGTIPRSLKKKVIISECEKSLTRLKVETIDIYFAHSYDPETPIEESIEAFDYLKQQGKIRFAAASNFPSWRLEQAINTATQNQWVTFQCLQQRHTFLEPNLRATFGNQLLITPEIEDLCSHKQLTLMAYSPLLGGAYSRSDITIPVAYQSDNTEKRLLSLQILAKKRNVSVNQLVLAWMLHSSPKILPIISGSSLNQLKENMGALELQLSYEEMKSLNLQT